MIKWLHRIGYVTTVALCLQIIAILGAFGWYKLQDERRIARIMDSSRTASGALAISDADILKSMSAGYLAALPGLRTLSGNGLRFFSMPSFGPKWYAIALSLKPGSDRATGIMFVTERMPDRTTTLAPVNFSIPRQHYLVTVQRLDNLADGFSGDTEDCADGTPVAFERIRNNQVESGVGSASCSRHYKAISQFILKGLSASDPTLNLPNNGDWMPNMKDED